MAEQQPPGEFEIFQRGMLCSRLAWEAQLADKFQVLARGVARKVAEGGDRENVAFCFRIAPDAWNEVRRTSDALVARLLDRPLEEIAATEMRVETHEDEEIVAFSFRDFTLTENLELAENQSAFPDGSGFVTYWVNPVLPPSEMV